MQQYWVYFSAINKIEKHPSPHLKKREKKIVPLQKILKQSAANEDSSPHSNNSFNHRWQQQFRHPEDVTMITWTEIHSGSTACRIMLNEGKECEGTRWRLETICIAHRIHKKLQLPVAPGSLPRTWKKHKKTNQSTLKSYPKNSKNEQVIKVTNSIQITIKSYWIEADTKLFWTSLRIDDFRK